MGPNALSQLTPPLPCSLSSSFPHFQQLIPIIPHRPSLQTPLPSSLPSPFLSTTRLPILARLTAIANSHSSAPPTKEASSENFPPGFTRSILLGAASIGLMVLLSELCEQRAMALGPEGPLMEEFWENVRRYGLYILTVSTGAIYTILQPILELLRNPLSAVLVLVIFAGSLFLVSQVLNAMIGVTEFAYDYAY